MGTFPRTFSIMANNKILVEFFYDVISPYSWLGFEVLQRYKTLWNIDVQLMPALLAGIMKASGNRPPALVPNKGQYIRKDISRLSEYYAVPVRLPENIFEILMEKGSLDAQRFITAIKMICPEHTEAVSRELWMRVYCKHEDITQVESFKEVAKVCEIDDKSTNQALSLLNEQKVKDQLKQVTNKALEYGAFGAPTIVAHIAGKPELFFGCNCFELMAHALGKKWYGPTPQLNQSKL